MEGDLFNVNWNKVKFGEIMAKTTESNALQTLEEFVAEQKRIVEERKAQLHKQDKKINQVSDFKSDDDYLPLE